MNVKDLKSKCSRAMLESGPMVEVALTIPRPAALPEGANAVKLGLLRDGGPMARVVGESKVGERSMLNVNIRAASILQALEQAAPED
jgi:hypothetical protein